MTPAQRAAVIIGAFPSFMLVDDTVRRLVERMIEDQIRAAVSEALTMQEPCRGDYPETPAAVPAHRELGGARLRRG